MHKNFLPVIILLLIAATTIILRVRLLDVPLERDEGEYAYIGQQILEGTPPYSEAYNMKFPGIYFIYAAILWLFGQTHIAIHSCLLIVNVLSMVLLFIFARRAYDGWVGAAASGAFALLSISYHVQGYWANAEHFILPFVLGANLLLLLALRNDRTKYFLLSGILFGCAALVKQHGAFFGMGAFAALLVWIWHSGASGKIKYWKYSLVFLGGVALPLLLCFSYLAYAGVLKNFYLWTFAYAKEYTSLIPASEIQYYFLANFIPLWQHTILIWIISGVGFIAMFFVSRDNGVWILMLGLFIASLVALSAGFYFRPHYFVLVIPVIALLFGIGTRFIFQIFSTASLPVVRYFPPIFIVALTFVGTLAAHWDVLVQFSPAEATLTRYGQNPFLYSSMIAEMIKAKTLKDDRIAIIGNEPQFLFYSQRRSATSFIYTYSLTEDQSFAGQFRREMMHQVETAAPKLIILTHVRPEWYAKPNGEKEINAWVDHLTQSYYTLASRFEYSNNKDTLLVTDPASLAMKPTHIFWISLYERRKD